MGTNKRIDCRDILRNDEEISRFTTISFSFNSSMPSLKLTSGFFLTIYISIGASVSIIAFEVSTFESCKTSNPSNPSPIPIMPFT
jgi:hypothetical protein